jgi:hypothetical protein
LLNAAQKLLVSRFCRGGTRLLPSYPETAVLRRFVMHITTAVAGRNRQLVSLTPGCIMTTPKEEGSMDPHLDASSGTLPTEAIREGRFSIIKTMGRGVFPLKYGNSNLNRSPHFHLLVPCSEWGSKSRSPVGTSPLLNQAIVESNPQR